MVGEKVAIEEIFGEEILDSRGSPTVRVMVCLRGGARGVASVPSGASTGSFEAFELRDGDPTRYGGRGVLRAVEHVNTRIREALVGTSALEQEKVDAILCKLDGTPQKKKLGANAILGVSLAVLRAAAEAVGLPLWQYVGGAMRRRMPVPMMNILNGGAHAKNGLDVQEFMILPVGASSFREALQMGCETTILLGRILHSRGLATGVGDEGGFAPALSSEKEALDLLKAAIDESKYGEDRIKIALDAAATEWVDGKVYRLPKSGRVFTSAELAEYWRQLLASYPIVSLEDGLGEEDWEGWRRLTATLSPRLTVGDDLFVTNTQRFAKGMEMGAGNAILIKPNQIGTVSETARVIRMAKTAGYRVILSHRSGETEDTSLADLAVGFEADFIKAGAPCRSERVAKYNRLLEIERQMQRAEYGRGETEAFCLKSERIPL